MKLPHRTSLAALLLILTAIGCGDDDDNPAAANSPCLDANTECASFSLRASDMVFTESYQDVFPPATTTFTGLWPTAGQVLAGYGPGKRMIVHVRFNPPLVVRNDAPSVHVSVSAGVLTGCSNRFVQVTPEINIIGDWAPSESQAAMSGSCSDGSSYIDLFVDFLNLEVGQSLHSVMWTFIVPETYTSGGAVGSPILPADLDVVGLGWSSSVVGDERGNPPIWPGEFP